MNLKHFNVMANRTLPSFCIHAMTSNVSESKIMDIDIVTECELGIWPIACVYYVELYDAIIKYWSNVSFGKDKQIGVIMELDEDTYSKEKFRRVVVFTYLISDNINVDESGAKPPSKFY